MIDDLKISKVNKHWIAMFEHLVDFKKRYEHTYVPRTYGRLGRWADDQRVHYRLFNSGKVSLLNEEKIEMLESIGFSWEHDSKRSKKWQEMYQELIEFKKVNGNCNVPKKYPENQKLGSWVDYQRTLYRSRNAPEDGFGKNNSMTPARIDALEKIGFRWFPSGCDEDQKKSSAAAVEESYKVNQSEALNLLSSVASKAESSPEPDMVASSRSPSCSTNETAAALKDLKPSVTLRRAPEKVVRPSVTAAAMANQMVEPLRPRTSMMNKSSTHAVSSPTRMQARQNQGTPIAINSPTMQRLQHVVNVPSMAINGQKVVRIVNVPVHNNAIPVRTVLVPAPAPVMQMHQPRIVNLHGQRVQAIVVQSMPNCNIQYRGNQQPRIVMQNNRSQQQVGVSDGPSQLVSYVNSNNAGAPVFLMAAPTPSPRTIIHQQKSPQQSIIYQ